MEVGRPRLHALDALRAAMMLLGLVLHTAANYTHTPLQDAWPYQDASRFILFDVSLGLIHIFRMPVFFVMAGFFAALLLAREGAGGFLRHRANRLLIPLAFAWPLIFPAIKTGFAFAIAGGGGVGLDAARAVILNEPYAGPHLAHLWFIWQLFILSAAAVVVAALVARVPSSTRERALETFARVAPTTRGCFVMGAIAALVMLAMPTPGLETSVAFVPALRVLVFYGICMAFGWLLFRRPAVLTSMSARPWQRIGIGLGFSWLHLMALAAAPAIGLRAAIIGANVMSGFAMWLLIYGITGLFLRHFDRPHPRQRYLSDASYWMYILHLPIVIWLAGALSPLALPAVVKFAVVLGGTTLVTFVSYHYCVRATAIGVLLNGRRYLR